MTEKLKQITKEEVGKLQREAQEAINSLDWGSLAEEIGKKYLLNESEVNDLQVETLLVLVGIEDGNDFAQNVENNVGTSKAEAEKISEEIFQKIFIPINDVLTEKVKKSDSAKNPKPEQTLNFILSGGNYSAFMENAKTGETLDSSNLTTSEKFVKQNEVTNIKDNFVI